MLLNFLFVLLFFLISIILYYFLQKQTTNTNISPSKLNQVCADGLIPCEAGLSCITNQCKSNFECQQNNDCVPGLICAGNKVCMDIEQDGLLLHAPDPYSGCVFGTILDKTGTICVLDSNLTCYADNQCYTNFCDLNSNKCSTPPSFGQTCNTICSDFLHCDTHNNLSLCQDNYNTSSPGSYCTSNDQCSSKNCEMISSYGICSSNGIVEFSEQCSNNSDCKSSTCINNICALPQIGLKNNFIYTLDTELKEVAQGPSNISTCINFTGYKNILGILNNDILYVYTNNAWTSVTNSFGIDFSGNPYTFDTNYNYFSDCNNIFGHSIYYSNLISQNSIKFENNRFDNIGISGLPLFIRNINTYSVIVGTLYNNKYYVNFLSTKGINTQILQSDITYNSTIDNTNYRTIGPSMDGMYINGKIYLALLHPVGNVKKLYYFSESKLNDTNQSFNINSKLKFIDSKLFIYNI